MVSDARPPMSLLPHLTSAATAPSVARGFAPRSDLLQEPLYSKVNKTTRGANGAAAVSRGAGATTNVIVNPTATSAASEDDRRWFPLLKQKQQESTL